MAESVEKVYADALFEISEEDNSSETVNGELKAVAAVLAENPELVKLLCTPTVSGADKLSVISKIFGGRLSADVYNFLCLVTQKGRAAHLIRIADTFREMYNDKAGIAEVTVTTAEELSPALERKLSDKLAAKLGKKIILIKKVDPSIIGGVIVRYGNTMTDGSVRAKLDAVKASISSRIA